MASIVCHNSSFCYKEETSTFTINTKIRVAHKIGYLGIISHCIHYKSLERRNKLIRPNRT